MRRLSSLLLLVAVLAIGPQVTSAQTPDESDEVIRVETDVTNLPFTALDKQRRFITTLRQEDIRVFEDNVPQQVFTFQRETDRPLALALLIDVSASEERTLPAEKAAARSFIETVIQSRKDQAAVIPFTGSAYLEQPLTRDVLGIYRALERVEVAMPAYLGSGRAISGIVTGPGTRRQPREGSTAIWDAIALTASEVLLRSAEPGQSPRRAIILLTDGQDTSSVLAIDQAINRALIAETVIYAIGIGDSKYEGVDRSSLRTVAERTGGRAFFPKKEEDLQQVFREIERELRTQYLIAYSSSNKKRDGAYRQIRLEIINSERKKDQVTLRHRPGYFAKTSIPSR